MATGEIGVVDTFFGAVEEPERRDTHRVLQSYDAAALAAYSRALSATSYVHQRTIIGTISPLTALLEVMCEGEVVMVVAEEIAPVHLLKVT